ncbi:MAG: HD superfamily phosphohydrolase [Sediminicola sp.]
MDSFSEDMLRTFAELDDYDIVSALKSWVKVDDYVLQNLSKMILNRDLLKIKLKKKPVSQRRIKKERKEFMNKHNLSEVDASYFVFTGEIFNQAYNMEEETINLLTDRGKVVDVAKASDQLNLEALSKKVVKYYLCYPKSNY